MTSVRSATSHCAYLPGICDYASAYKTCIDSSQRAHMEFGGWMTIISSAMSWAAHSFAVGHLICTQDRMLTYPRSDRDCTELDPQEAAT
jgi:hypothetical protein